MTAPREIVCGRVYFLSRRCTQRQFLLRPGPDVEQIYLYCLGEAAERYGITLHAWLAMSNHEHLIVTDNFGNMPEFMAHFRKMTAKALNAHWGRWENFWAAEQASVVYLVEAEDRFEKLVYLIANPVAADLVDRLSDWPGASSFAQHLSGRSRVVSRPEGFFSEDGPMPQTVTLVAAKLPGFADLDQEAWSAKIERAAKAAEESAREARQTAKRRIVGRKEVLRQKPTDSPKTVAPRGGLRPHVACGNVERRRVELAALRKFRVAHRIARRSWSTGEREVIFPAGTYRMRDFGICCASDLDDADDVVDAAQ